MPPFAPHGVWRCPEELVEGAMVQEYDKCDIYMFGNLLFELLTGQEPWHFDNYTREADIRPTKVRGRQPTLPDWIEIESLSEKKISTMMEAMKQCFELDPGKRPTAGELVDMLSSS